MGSGTILKANDVVSNGLPLIGTVAVEEHVMFLKSHDIRLQCI